MNNNLYQTWSVILGLFLMTSGSQAARATTLILGKSKLADSKETSLEEVPPTVPVDSIALNEASINATAMNATKLTGVPQIDYIYDPNLPRELNGYNLTDYPFYNAIPEDIDFKCDGLHDGFYASVPHKCQVYHHCLFGTRYDFLCANYTAFDQKTFICHFASEVDCKNSPKYFKRNEALYKQDSTTTAAPPSTTTAASSKKSEGGRRKRPPTRRRKPSHDYYDDDYEESYSEVDYDEEPVEKRRKKPRPPPARESEPDDYGGETVQAPSPTPNKSVYDRPRVAPKIRRPVPINEREKYDYSSDARLITTKETPVEEPLSRDHEEKTDVNIKKKNKPHAAADSAEDDLTKKSKGNGKEPAEKDRGRVRDTEEDDREWDRERERERDRSRDRDRDRDRDRPRDRERPRPGKKRRRPETYEYDEEYEDYEEMRRRPVSRERPRYSDDDDYDEPYYRKTVRERDRDRYRDRPRHRYRDYDPPPKRIKYDDEDYRDSPDKNEKQYRNDGRGRYSTRYDSYEDDDGEEPPYGSGKQHKIGASTNLDMIEPIPKRKNKGDSRIVSEKLHSEEEVRSKERAEEKKVFGEERNEPRLGSVQRVRPATAKPVTTTSVVPPLEEKPVPAPLPAYITAPGNSNSKQLNKFSAKRPVVSSDESHTSYESVSQETSQEEPQLSTKSRKAEATSSPSSKPEPSQENTPKLKVPFEESSSSEELAPKAPKIPVMSPYRRPFLPSRGGSPTLPRGLVPVGAKAFSLPKHQSAEIVQEEPPLQPIQVSSNKAKYPTGIEFRARLTANIGVGQPRLQSEDISDVAEEDYTAESEEYDNQKLPTIRPFNTGTLQVTSTNRPISKPEKPTMRPTEDLPQISLADVHGNVEQHSQVQLEDKPIRVAQRIPQQQQQQQQQQLGPQTFYSENPKFKTFAGAGEPLPRPTPTSQQFQIGTHVPGPYKVSRVGQNPAVKFPGNYEETDEYDVSYNDALQPISSLQPRNTEGLNLPRTVVRRKSQQPATAGIVRSPSGDRQRVAESLLRPLSLRPFQAQSTSFYTLVQ